MGYGPVVNGKQLPITQYKNSWAWEMEQRRPKPTNQQPKQAQWPIGHLTQRKP